MLYVHITLYHAVACQQRRQVLCLVDQINKKWMWIIRVNGSIPKWTHWAARAFKWEVSGRAGLSQRYATGRATWWEDE